MHAPAADSTGFGSAKEGRFCARRPGEAVAAASLCSGLGCGLEKEASASEKMVSVPTHSKICVGALR